MRFETLPEFERDLKRLVKKYRSLPQDIEVLKKALLVNPTLREPQAFRVPRTGLRIPVYKVWHFRCRSLGGGSRSGLRVIYAYFEEGQRTVFTEMYHKNQKEELDMKRLRRYFS